jgi:hypothetical protein
MVALRAVKPQRRCRALAGLAPQTCRRVQAVGRAGSSAPAQPQPSPSPSPSLGLGGPAARAHSPPRALGEGAVPLPCAPALERIPSLQPREVTGCGPRAQVKGSPPPLELGDPREPKSLENP